MTDQRHWLVGTSGYAYSEWVDAGFYPPGTRGRRMLAYYVGRFPAVELNYTWYQMPRADAVARQQQAMPPGFTVAAKLVRQLTHEVVADDWAGTIQQYRDGMAPLRQSNQLAAVLVQLPPGFDRTLRHRRYLAQLFDALCDLPLAVEFRHRSWACDPVYAELQRRRVTLVTVDVPDLPGLFPAVDVVTNPELLYIRFHGRNVRGWRSGDMQRQFDYSYSDDELAAWIASRARSMGGTAGSRGVMFFNNHVAAQAPANARRMGRLLADAGMTVVPAPSLPSVGQSSQTGAA